MARIIDTGGICWFCKKRDKDPDSSYNTTHTFEKKAFVGYDGMNKWSKTTTYTKDWVIPRCKKCEKIHEMTSNIVAYIVVAACIILFIGLILALDSEGHGEIVGALDNIFDEFWDEIFVNIFYASFFALPGAFLFWVLTPFLCGTKPKFTSRFIPEIYQFIRKGT